MKNTVLKFSMLFAVALFCAGFVSCKKEKTEYIDEFGCYEQTSEAIEAATAADKNILLIITMNGDDSESDKFTQSFFKSSDFENLIAKDYVLLHFDLGQKSFERTTAGANASKKEKEAADEFSEILQLNFRFAQLLGISYTPCVFLLTKQGYFISELPASPNEYSPSAFSTVLDSFKALKDEFNSLAAATENGSVVERVNAIDALYNRTDEDHRILLLDLTRKVVDIDFDNKSGLLSKYLFETSVNLAMYCMLDNDIEGAVQSIVSVCSNPNLEPLDKQNAWYMAAYILMNSYSTDYNTILTYLQASVMSAPESEIAPQIQQMYDYVKSAVEESEAQAQQNSLNLNQSVQ